MKLPSLLLIPALAVAFSTTSCRSSGSKKKETEESRESSRLGDPHPDARTGGYYKMRKNINHFFFNVPNFTDVLPNRYLMRGHVVQLLDPSVGDGWARVKNEDLEIGYVKFDNLKVVPPEKEPKPKERHYDEELDKRIGGQ